MEFPKYLNTDISEDILTDTRTFLSEVIGCYVEVSVRTGNPNISLYLNKSMIKNQALSDNSRCYTQWSVPSQSREHGIWKVIQNLCEEQDIPDSTIFISLGDFPIINKSKSTHPHPDKYPGNCYSGIYPNKLYPIFSRSIIPDTHDDLLFPTRDFIDMVYGFDNLVANTNKNFASKKPIGVFRGSITGLDRTISNTRIQAKILALQYPEHLDVELTRTFDYYMFESPELCVCTQIDDKRIYDPDKPGISLSGFEQARNYKYLLHIDGFVSAWRLGLELMSWSVILKVDSPWVEHYYWDLHPWIHYIPVKSDLSDLIQLIDWCEVNQEKCIQIASNAYEWAIQNMTKTKLFDWVESCLREQPIDNCMGKTSLLDNHPYKKQRVYFKPDWVKFNEIPKPKQVSLDNISYSRYLLTQTQEEKTFRLFEKNFYEFEVDSKLCETIENETINSGIRKNLRSNPDLLNTYTGFITNFSDEYNDKIRELKLIVMDQIKHKLNIQIEIIEYHHMFSNSPLNLWSGTELPKMTGYIPIIVFLSNTGGYKLNNLTNDFVKASVGKVVMFTNKVEFKNKFNCVESSQVLFFCRLAKPSFNYLLGSNNFVECSDFADGLKKLASSIQYTETIKTNNSIIFNTIESSEFAGCYFVEQSECEFEPNEFDFSQTNCLDLTFNAQADLIGDFSVWIGEKELKDKFQILMDKIFYKPNEFINQLKPTYSKTGVQIVFDYNKFESEDLGIFKSTEKIILKFKAYLLQNDLRKFVASV